MENCNETKFNTTADCSNARTRKGYEFVPVTDIIENKNNVVLFLEMPGVEDKHLNITLEKGILTIEGIVDSACSERSNSITNEFLQGNYRRSFNLSDELNGDGIEAVLKNGVLTITIPKSEKVMPKKILVKSN